MADVGRGTIDFSSIFRRAMASGMRHVFVEHDQPADALASARASYDYLRNLEI
jgi:sugar phosphate isomerase/epimerase